MVRRRSAGLLGVSALALVACNDATVSVAFEPEIGDRYEYRYEIDVSVTREVDGAEPETREFQDELVAEQEVLARTRDGARVEVELARAGGSSRTAVVLIDRAGSLQGIQLIEGLGADVFGLADADSLVTAPSDGPPDGDLAPGDRWTIREGARRGEGRLVRLGVVDGVDVAVVRTSSREPLDQSLVAGDSATQLAGVLRSGATTTYDLTDGAIRRSRSWSRGEIEARLAPPRGVDAAPVDATISYDISVRVTRTD